MASITFKGKPVRTNGEPPKAGDAAPRFELTTSKLEEVGLSSWKGKKKIITVNPSLDTGICATTARSFNQKASSLDNTVVLVVTSDLPFAQKRFCETEGLANVVPLSMMRDRHFAEDWGLLMEDGPLRGLVARAVFVVDENDKVTYSELVSEIAQEPNYENALAALRGEPS
jgi:thiol peroxidase